VIADDSPAHICERGLSEAHPEKKPKLNVSAAILVHSLQSALDANSWKKWASFAYFRKKKGRFSPQSRLHGGGRGIRTPGTLSGTVVFKTTRFDRSRIPPSVDHISPDKKGRLSAAF
jgi:hypothetical protein